jgi:hypothetical protein
MNKTVINHGKTCGQLLTSNLRKELSTGLQNRSHQNLRTKIKNFSFKLYT